MDMHRSGRTGDHEGQYIRLRYSMQFMRGGQPHTIEMEVSVPVGASVEERDQLIREAEANIEQLYRQIEKRGAGRPQQPPEASRPQVAPAQAGSHPAPPATPARTPAQPAQPVQTAQAVAQAPARDTAQASAPQGKREAAEMVAPARTSIGPEMPVTPNLSSTASGNIRLPEFIQVIRNNWALTPKDAMELLQVTNLNNMNYRELLRQLELLVAQRGKVASKNTDNATRAPATSAPAASAVRPSTPATPSAPTSAMRDASVRPAAASSPSTPATPANATNRAAPPTPKQAPPAPPQPPSPALDGPANIPVYPLPNTLREAPRSYKFDEEDDDAAEETPGGSGEDENSVSEALAHIKIDKLRENRGNAVVSPARLTVLHNLLDSQISDEQFQQLIEGLWSINADKKLKQDQVEALISWAKEDYFDDEVRAVIAVLKG